MGWKSKLAGISLSAAVIIAIVIYNLNSGEEMPRIEDKVQKNAEERFAINNGVNIDFNLDNVLANIDVIIIIIFFFSQVS